MGKAKNIKKTGIILYETIVAAVVMTLCITITLRAFTSALRAAQVTEYYLKANTLFKEKFIEYFLMPSLKAGTYRGSFPAPYSNFSWTSSIEEIQLNFEKTEETEGYHTEEEETNFYNISIQISWEMRGRTMKIAMSALHKIKNETSEIVSDPTEPGAIHQEMMNRSQEITENTQFPTQQY